uniref:Uncharacterized protein n=1 Tax=Mucochytrium quahogii TaxID=96639 RepID=A0A7S2SGZ0_9STRA|mmetsp:Transcript_28271/g.45566  ORF Transcript_28271/g.45566 Transcript_28271/m.45566 type:complete len:126 (+) Transcript_28271:3-380(+)
MFFDEKRICANCHQERPRSDFYDAAPSDTAPCKPCTRLNPDGIQKLTALKRSLYKTLHSRGEMTAAKALTNRVILLFLRNSDPYSIRNIKAPKERENILNPESYVPVIITPNPFEEAAKKANLLF